MCDHKANDAVWFALPNSRSDSRDLCVSSPERQCGRSSRYIDPRQVRAPLSWCSWVMTQLRETTQRFMAYGQTMSDGRSYSEREESVTNGQILNSVLLFKHCSKIIETVLHKFSVDNNRLRQTFDHALISPDQKQPELMVIPLQ